MLARQARLARRAPLGRRGAHVGATRGAAAGQQQRRVAAAVGSASALLLGLRCRHSAVRCEPALPLDESVEVGMDLTDTVIAHGKRRRVYDEKASRYDGSPLWLALSNLLLRIRERGLQMCGCCAALATSIWSRVDDWTVSGSLLAWASGSAAVATTVLGAMLALQRLLVGPPLSVPRGTQLALERLWRDRTEVEDQLLREIVAAEQRAGGPLSRPPAALSGLSCGPWSLLQRSAVVSPLPLPKGADEPSPTEKEWGQLLCKAVAACGYHSLLCLPLTYDKQCRPLPPPAFRDVSHLREWLQCHAGPAGRRSLSRCASAATCSKSGARRCCSWRRWLGLLLGRGRWRSRYA